jgi:hypothetical protein
VADNVQFSGTGWSPPENTQVATDDVGGVQYQRVKLDIGADGAASPITASNPMPLGTLPGGTLQLHGTNQALGTYQPHGTTQTLGTVQPLAGSVHIASTPPGTTQILGTVREAGAGLWARTKVAAGTETATFIGASAARRGVTVYNGGNAILYLALGSLAGTTDYTVQLTPGAYYETPYSYTGTLSGIWSVQTGVTGTAYITEVS